MLSKHCTVQSMVHKAGLIRDTSRLGTILLNTDTNVDSRLNLLFGYSFSFYLLINLLDIDILLAQKMFLTNATFLATINCTPVFCLLPKNNSLHWASQI